MGPLKAQVSELCAMDWRQNFLQPSSKRLLESVERTRVDAGLSTLNRRITGWVDEALKNVSTRADPRARLEFQDAKDLRAKDGLMGDSKAECTGSDAPKWRL